MKIYKSLSLILVAFLLQSNLSFAIETSTSSQYKIDDVVVENLFQFSEDVTFDVSMSNLAIPSQQNVQGEDKQLLAGIVALASWITGIGILIPIHRLILGTGNEVGKIIALYCVTLSGCGFILLIDGIMLLMDSEGNKYIENPKFIMWH